MNEEAQAKLYAALSKAQGAMGNAHKTRKGQVGQQPYKYADISAVEDAIGDALVANGLAIMQFPGVFNGESIELTTFITHEAGGSMSFTMQMPCAKKDAQGIGSAITYARRYALTAVLRIATDDDEGAAASRRDTPLVAAAREMTGAAPSTPSSAPRASSEATGALNSTPPVAGAFNLGQLKTAAAAAKLSPGILGAYMSGSKMPTAPTPEMLHEWLAAHEGFSVEGLLGQAAFWFVENGGKDDLKAQAAAYLETAEAA